MDDEYRRTDYKPFDIIQHPQTSITLSDIYTSNIPEGCTVSNAIDQILKWNKETPKSYGVIQINKFNKPILKYFQSSFAHGVINYYPSIYILDKPVKKVTARGRSNKVYFQIHV